MPLYILMLKSSVIWCRQQISQRAKPGRLLSLHTEQLFSSDHNFADFMPSCILMLYSVLYLNHFLFDPGSHRILVYGKQGSLYCWTGKRVRSYFNRLMPPSSNQSHVQFFLLSYLISLFQCASAIQVNIKRWKLSNYLWTF